MRQITSLLVGEHFRPPAKLILAHLPSGCQLMLEPENDNPYDEEAVKVLVKVEEIPASQHAGLEAELPAMGFTLEQVMSGGEVWLGYIPKTGGKPLETARKLEPSLVGNHEFREEMLDSAHRATLAFGADGKARVVLTTGDN